MRVQIASAGTGKTTRLVAVYLKALDRHPPYRMAAVTFTRAAAAELATRLSRAIAESPRAELAGTVFATTIHGFFAELLRLFAPYLGLDPDFQRLEAPEAELLFAEEARSLLYLKGLEGELEALLALFQKRSLAGELRPQGPGAEALFALFGEALAAYHRRYLERHLGPTEIERQARRLVGLLTRNRALAARLRDRFRRVFVDEYQDTSPLQGEVFEGLAGLGVELYLVGDPKQSIYAFRNADVEVFRRALRVGERLPPLTKTYRHPPRMAAFLNRLTDGLARRRLGFSPEEAPPVEPAREGPSRVGLLKLEGEALDRLRPREAAWLAHRLSRLHREEGVPYRAMAVLVRSYGSIRFLEAAFRRHRVPYVVLGGRGLFHRPEVQDLYHALKAVLDPDDRLALASFLHSPFVGLSLEEALAVAAAPDPRSALAGRGAVRAYLEALRERAGRTPPLAFLEELVREPGPSGAGFLERLAPEARVNVDAVLFKLARVAAGRYPLLLAAFERLARVEDEGAFAEGGEDAVRVLTVHKAKGLEWPVVWAFDLNRGGGGDDPEIYVEPGGGAFARKGDPAYPGFQKAWKAREADEAYRLLYVALSRARERLYLSYSLGPRRPRRGNPAHALEALAPWEWPELKGASAVRRGGPPPPAAGRPQPRAAPPPAPEPPPPAGPGPLPAVVSPSALLEERAAVEDPEGPAEPDGAPARLLARAVGVLVHFAIAQDWPPEPEPLDALLRQEVARPLTAQERARVREEVAALLAAYRRLLAGPLVPLSQREEDRAEWPFVLPWKGAVIEGVIDRLYRAGGVWYLEDYKTDRVEGDLLDHAQKAGYAFQLGVYARAVGDALGVRPRVRLVFLRKEQVLELDEEVLEAALADPQLLPG